MNYLPQDSIILLKYLLLNPEISSDEAPIEHVLTSLYSHTPLAHDIRIAILDILNLPGKLVDFFVKDEVSDNAVNDVGTIAYAMRDDAELAFTARLTIDSEAIKKFLENYTEKFINEDLVAPHGFRFLSARKQMDDFTRCIRYLTADYGYKNIIASSEDIARRGGWFQTQNEIAYRLYEAFLALEKAHFIQISQIRKDGILFSLTPSAAADLNFQGKELHWYCGACGDRIEIIKEASRLIQRLNGNDGKRNCSNGHQNQVRYIAGDVSFETAPIQISSLLKGKPIDKNLK